MLPSALSLGEDAVELLLHQRIEPGSGFVEHKQRWPVEEGLQQPDLLFVPSGEIADRTGQLGIQPFGQFAGVREVGDAT